MMESVVNIEKSVRGARARQVGMPVCPHCGGNVRNVRDIYGAYYQCLQCSREVELAGLARPAIQTPGIVPMIPQSDERMVA